MDTGKFQSTFNHSARVSYLFTIYLLESKLIEKLLKCLRCIVVTISWIVKVHIRGELTFYRQLGKTLIIFIKYENSLILLLKKA